MTLQEVKSKLLSVDLDLFVSLILSPITLIARGIAAQTATIIFDKNGNPDREQSWVNGDKIGKCDVVQWGTLVQDIVVGTAATGGFTAAEINLNTIGGHRFEVTHGRCEADPFLDATSEGLCCDQRTSKVTYKFTKHCTIGALMATCGPKGWDMDTHPINDLTVTTYRLCDSCEADHTTDGCAAKGYCGIPSPHTNRMPAAMLCDRMCQPTQHGNCRPRHIFSELVSHLADQITPEE